MAREPKGKSHVSACFSRQAGSHSERSELTDSRASPASSATLIREWAAPLGPLAREPKGKRHWVLGSSRQAGRPFLAFLAFHGNDATDLMNG